MAHRLYPPGKLAADWMLALILLVLCVPLLLLLAAFVKLTSPGPVVYSQVRLGRGGRPYRVYKLRTMLHDCEAATGAVWALQDDPRTTPIGRFLRDTHLDELPQLWNVIRGEMSLIGPRPERPEIAAQIERILPAYAQRLAARPGLTGLAQLRLAADSNVDGVRRKLAHDLYYVRHLGPVLDLQLTLATVFYLAARLAKSCSHALIRTHAQRVDDGRLHPATPARDAHPVELQLTLLDAGVAAAAAAANTVADEAKAA
jgi:lipopolysaccharide/colanic/teichoic acid biosynthesis glycosyltransferase